MNFVIVKLIIMKRADHFVSLVKTKPIYLSNNRNEVV